MKKNLLFIGPTLPMFDRHSGDLRLFTILEILAKSCGITYLAKEWASGCSPEDNDRYISLLKDLGISVSVANYSLKDILRSSKFHAAIMEFYHIAEYYLPRTRLLQPSCSVIVDSVDVHFLRLDRKYQITGDRNDLQLAEATKARELAVYGKADITLTVTEEDAQSLRMENPDITVRVLPNVHYIHHSKTPRNRNEIIFVGGFKHEPNIDAVVYFCEDILPRIRNVIPEARFAIVGSNPPEQIKALSSDSITVTGYVPSTTPWLEKSYVSVAPLRYGAGMKGKVGEAMAHGLPVVTTTIGAEGMGLIDRESVMIADSPESFSDAVIELMLDQNLYQKIQKNSIAHIENHYAPPKISSLINLILEELDGISPKKLSISNTAFFFLNYAMDMAKRKTK